MDFISAYYRERAIKHVEPYMALYVWLHMSILGWLKVHLGFSVKSFSKKFKMNFLANSTCL